MGALAKELSSQPASQLAFKMQLCMGYHMCIELSFTSVILRIGFYFAASPRIDKTGTYQEYQYNVHQLGKTSLLELFDAKDTCNWGIRVPYSN